MMVGTSEGGREEGEGGREVLRAALHFRHLLDGIGAGGLRELQLLDLSLGSLPALPDSGTEEFLEGREGRREGGREGGGSEGERKLFGSGEMWLLE